MYYYNYYRSIAIAKSIRKDCSLTGNNEISNIFSTDITSTLNSTY